MNEKIKIAGVQMNPRLMNNQANLSVILEKMQETAQNEAVLAIFPECALCGYCFESLEEAIPYAETIPGPSTLRIAEACHKLRIYAILGLLEKDQDRVFNAAALVGPTGFMGKYRKSHLPALGIDKHVQPGDLGFAVYETEIGRIGLNICYDGSFPESARVMALKGADLIVLPTNWPTGAEEFAEYLINARGLENHIFCAAVNRVGEERGFQFIGRSRIVDFNGKTLAQASPDKEEIIYAVITPTLARDKQIVRVPGKHEINRFKDRRPDLYGEITKPVEDKANREDAKGAKY